MTDAERNERGNLTDDPEPATGSAGAPVKQRNERGNLTGDPEPKPDSGGAHVELRDYDERQDRERARSYLALGLLGLLILTVGGVLFFVGADKLEGSAVTESVLPAVVALAGTALGFYFGQNATNRGTGTGISPSSTVMATPSPSVSAVDSVLAEYMQRILANALPPSPDTAQRGAGLEGIGVQAVQPASAATPVEADADDPKGPSDTR